MDKIDIKGFDYIELYVGNLVQSCHFYKTVMGFTPVAESDPTNGFKDRRSCLLKQNNIYIVLTSPLVLHSAVAQHVHIHGDGVKDIAFTSGNVENDYELALRRGAKSVLAPTVIEDGSCKIIKATISSFGDTCHSFIEREKTLPNFLPNFKLLSNTYEPSEAKLRSIDHVAICLEQGSLITWRDFYQVILDFQECHREDVQTENSGMKSFALQNALGNSIFTLVEPVQGKKKSQISEFLEYYGSAGVQHIAFLSDDIMESVNFLRNKGMEFLSIPGSYYEALPNRIDNIKESLPLLEHFQILADRDQNGFLFQIFSKILQSRPTFFIEVIQRVGAKGFGSGNIKALFEAIEREQAIREPIV